MGANYQTQRTRVTSRASSHGGCEVGNGGFLLVEESNFQALPQGACVRVQTVGFSKLQAGDYVVISGEGTTVARRFVRLVSSNGVTRLVVADGARQQESIPFPRLVGRVSGAKLDGQPFNPNPRGFFQRAAFKLSHSVFAQPALGSFGSGRVEL